MLFRASIATGYDGNSTHFEKHATRFVNGVETHHLLYRKATAEDLGHENDGSIHQYRVQDVVAEEGEDVPLHKRVEKSTYKVVTDYLWKDE